MKRVPAVKNGLYIEGRGLFSPEIKGLISWGEQVSWGRRDHVERWRSEGEKPFKSLVVFVVVEVVVLISSESYHFVRVYDIRPCLPLFMCHLMMLNEPTYTLCLCGFGPLLLLTPSFFLSPPLLSCGNLSILALIWSAACIWVVSRSPGSESEMQNLRPTAQALLNLHFNRMPRWFECTIPYSLRNTALNCS